MNDHRVQTESPGVWQIPQSRTMITWCPLRSQNKFQRVWTERKQFPWGAKHNCQGMERTHWHPCTSTLHLPIFTHLFAFYYFSLFFYFQYLFLYCWTSLKMYVHVFTNVHIYTDIPIITHIYYYTERNLYTLKHLGVLAWVASLHMSLFLYLSPFFMIILCPGTFLHFPWYIWLLWPFYSTSFPISCT